ncbi:hypothetical protein LTR62_002810 [Meristemomyces frigidus]|uniref:Protein kinase domain-containing protein n=1 Tax=Meristemomyces frigidus TaxID=1508187 RepID=A0AAN7YSJ6_9PEZI|nr:hypothetical protein LTR62_002810 [Meristemomyces frigidus]
MNVPSSAGQTVQSLGERNGQSGGSEDKQAGSMENGSAAPERHDSKTSVVDGQPTQVPLRLGQSEGGCSASETWQQMAWVKNEQAAAHNGPTHRTPPKINTGCEPSSQSTVVHRGSEKQHSPASIGLHLKTDVQTSAEMGFTRSKETPTIFETPVSTELALPQSLTSPMNIPARGSSLRSNLSASSIGSSFSPGSALPSPYLAALGDLTPLPSPLVDAGPDSPTGLWRRPGSGHIPNRSRQSSLADDPQPALTTISVVAPGSPSSPPRKRKGYGSLQQETVVANAAAAQEKSELKSHGRNRSISEFKPEILQNLRPRHVTFGPGDAASLEANEYHMQREAYLAAQRGLTASAPPATSTENSAFLPTPPASTSSIAESDEADIEDEIPILEDGTPAEYLEVHCGIHQKRRKFRQLRQLGQGTFSTVVLATRERIPGQYVPSLEPQLDPHKLVAVKIVAHGPAGGADEERIETSLKREVEMLKAISHPSLIHLKACEYQATRSLLVLTYCPGGDLFDLASQKRDLLTPHMVQRMFAEMVSAVRYLHDHWIVHRDIKLENVLVNMPVATLAHIATPTEHPTPIITLTDLGLSRRIPQPPESPLLTTRCGSEDYAAPEILLGQPYDGRQTDAWALGVLLFALMEGRLPFDAPPGKPERSRNTHRIARCDWIWCRFGDEDGEWDEQSSVGKSWSGAREVVEALLKKVRMGRKALNAVAGMEWVQRGIQVEGGLKVGVEDEDEL